MQQPSYSISRTIAARDFQEAIERATKALSTQGFGVLTTIDVRATFRKKLDVEFGDYTILGACNPTLAHQALGHDAELGLLLPCNVVVRSAEDGFVVSAIDPRAVFRVSGDAELEPIADEVAKRLTKAIDAL